MELMNQTKLINKIMSNVWSEIWRNEIFQNICGWKMFGGLVYSNF